MESPQSRVAPVTFISAAVVIALAAWFSVRSSAGAQAAPPPFVPTYVEIAPHPKDIVGSEYTTSPLSAGGSEIVFTAPGARPFVIKDLRVRALFAHVTGTGIDTSLWQYQFKLVDAATGKDVLSGNAFEDMPGSSPGPSGVSPYGWSITDAGWRFQSELGVVVSGGTQLKLEVASTFTGGATSQFYVRVDGFIVR